jgi:aminoglycoside 6'-N-acetyltransferase I
LPAFITDAVDRGAKLISLVWILAIIEPSSPFGNFRSPMPNTARFAIRRVTSSDQPEWFRMRRLLWPEASADDLSQEMASIVTDPRTPVFVAERFDGGLGGFLEAGTRPYADGCDSSPVGYIEGWFVDEDLRLIGVGRALVEAVEDWARALGLREIASDAFVGNDSSLKAHLALGYQEKERLIHFVKVL